VPEPALDRFNRGCEKLIFKEIIIFYGVREREQMAEQRVTRGYGLLETWLAKQRARVVDQLIPPVARSGRLLDIGCGAYPFFLAHTEFREKVGLDSAVEKIDDDSMALMTFDLHCETALPFEDNFFDVVTMLAVFEHIEPARLSGVLSEIRRVLKPGGLYILTTPAKWADKLLRTMAKLRLVSQQEIEDHKDVYDHAKISSLLRQANFKGPYITGGFFELFMNLWVSAMKEGTPA
jgi:ubiquinone/menaquinone biosynthesis C-methylase UbiE